MPCWRTVVVTLEWAGCEPPVLDLFSTV